MYNKKNQQKNKKTVRDLCEGKRENVESKNKKKNKKTDADPIVRTIFKTEAITQSILTKYM